MGASMKTNQEKSRIEKTPVFEKTMKIGYSVLRLRKPSFKTKVIRFEKSHNAKNCKRDPLRFFTIHSAAKFQKKMKTLKNFRKPFGDFEKVPEKSLTKSRKGRESHSSEKVRTFCFGILVKKLAHTLGFEHETPGLKSKHLTTRPRTPELCDLRAETRELSRGKKSKGTFPQHLLITSVNKPGTA